MLLQCNIVHGVHGLLNLLTKQNVWHSQYFSNLMNTLMKFGLSNSSDKNWMWVWLTQTFWRNYKSYSLNYHFSVKNWVLPKGLFILTHFSKLHVRSLVSINWIMRKIIEVINMRFFHWISGNSTIKGSMTCDYLLNEGSDICKKLLYLTLLKTEELSVSTAEVL